MVFGTLAPSMPSGSLTAVHTLAFSSSGPKSSRSSALTAGARGAAQHTVALEDLLETLLLDQAERHVERLTRPTAGVNGLSGGSLR